MSRFSMKDYAHDPGFQDSPGGTSGVLVDQDKVPPGGWEEEVLGDLAHRLAGDSLFPCVFSKNAYKKQLIKFLFVDSMDEPEIDRLVAGLREDVKRLPYGYKNQFPATVHFAVAVTLGTLRKRGIDDPTVAVLARSNDLVAEISDILEVPHVYKGRNLNPIPHDIVWDQELSASGGVAMAAALEFVSLDTPAAREAMHAKIEEYFLIKKDFCQRYGGRGAQAAGTKATRFGKSRARVAEGKALMQGSPKTFEAALSAIPALTGDPVRDWKAVRTAFQAHDDLKAIFQDARMIRLFRASDTLATALAGRWMERGTYEGSARLIRSVLDQEKLIGLERDPKGVSLMTIHKSKGKEFDGVVLVEGLYSSPFFLTNEEPDFAPSRRLLRVGITRARQFVIIVHSRNSVPLVQGQ